MDHDCTNNIENNMTPAHCRVCGKDIQPIVAVDYKGKHFVLTDKDCVEEGEIIDPLVDVSTLLASEELLRRYVADCLFYGIPTYVGGDEALVTRLDEMCGELD